MRTRENIKEILDDFQTKEQKTLDFDEEAIVAAYQKDNDHQSLTIKILSIFGGIMASLAFLGFLYLAGLFNSNISMLLFGIICIIGAVVINKKYDKIIFDTVSVSIFIIGFILFGFGLSEIKVNENIVIILFIIIALSTLVVAQNYILSFISVLIICGSVLWLIILNNGNDLIHIYVSSIALILTYFFLKEAKIISTSKAFSKLYNPIRIGLIFSFFAGLILLSYNGIISISQNFIWLSSVVIIAIVLYLVSILFDVLDITLMQQKIIIYTFCILILGPTAFSPAISGAILVILLSFWANYKTGLVIGIAAFIYFVSQYYYDLNFTLLTKSILLFSSGILFIVFYLFTHKKLATNEKI